MNKKIPIVSVLFLIIATAVVVLFGSEYVKSNFDISKKNSYPDTRKYTDTSATSEATVAATETMSDKKPDTAEFCKKYGTFEIKKIDLFQEYSTGPGETMRSIAQEVFNDETKAADLITINPMLISYEIDDELPMRSKIYIPDDKYFQEGVTNYIKAQGNITYNPEKPMFGINAPNSGTGPFIISDEIKDDLSTVGEDDCVEIVYGSRDYDAQKIVFEVIKQ
jgi:hypothetical protein